MERQRVPRVGFGKLRSLSELAGFRAGFAVVTGIHIWDLHIRGNVTMEQWTKPRFRQIAYAGFEDTGRSEQEAKRRQREEKQAREARIQAELEEALDLGLEESFPGSDPISVVQPPQTIYDKPAG
jgi:hypothetical protein